jgi:hypothetical protein
MFRIGAARLAAPLLACLLLAAPAAAAKPRCNTVTGKVLLKDDSIKVVSKSVKDKRLSGRRILGCALPRGRVFAIGERGTPRGDRYENSASYSLGAHAGTYIDVRRFYGDGAAQTQSVSYGVVDLYDGRRRVYYRGDSGEGGCMGGFGDSSQTTPPVEKLSIDSDGLFAVLYRSDPATVGCYPNDGQDLLLGYFDGGHTVLDLAPAGAIDPASVEALALEFRWNNAGNAHVAPAS